MASAMAMVATALPFTSTSMYLAAPLTSSFYVSSFSASKVGGHLSASEELRASALMCSSREGNLLWEMCGSTAASRKLNTSRSLSVRAAAATAAPKQKIRIKLRSYWAPLIEQACQQILEAAQNSNSQTMGPVPLPTKKRVYCVLRSPHVNKDSREHFEIRTHRRLIDLENLNAQTIDALMQLDLPAGVDVEVKLS
ncbi:unnamed protein product [Sphagnum troendelagicum]|uniref:Small ribosomal subunit protein uS10 domain-containing protein n=1 Tax=Sphagnum troendelagicum TaxID=128251 RepID=A0ABP0UM25_9BRYO